MAAVPIYVWNGTAWQETGPVIPASPIKYQTTAPTSPSTGDLWIDSDADVTTGSQQFQRFRFVASGGETSVSGVDANGATLAYTAGTEIVVLNGSTLVRGQDYTATTGSSITGLSPALVASDVLEVFSFMAFNVANTYTQSQVDGFRTGNTLQIVNATYSTVTNMSSATYADTGLSATITPSSASNKILVLVNQSGVNCSVDNNGINLKLVRNSTDLITFAVAYVYSKSGAIMSASTTYLDSPNTTSAVTYKTQQARYSGAGIAQTQANGDTSTITLIEIKG